MAAIGAPSYFECRMCSPPLCVTKTTKAQILLHLEFEDGILKKELEDHPELYYTEMFLGRPGQGPQAAKPKLKRRRDDDDDDNDDAGETKLVKRISTGTLLAELGMRCKR